MTTYKTIIVDDEPIAIRVIKNHLSNFEEFEVLAECDNAIEAMKVLRNHEVDLVFLDIEMPTLTGLDLIKALPSVPQVIFTTAHRNYAVEAFEVNALDYLMKPISIERFSQAIIRFLDSRQTEKTIEGGSGGETITLKVDKKHFKLSIGEILYIESLADYVVVHTANEKMITKERISHLEERLGDFGFLRVHRGFLVNLEKVNAWYGNTLEIGHSKIPVGRNYKEIVTKKLG